MISEKIGSAHLLKLDTHEEFLRELNKFLDEKGIENASVTAIGAINSITLGFFDTQTQEYKEQSMHKSFELTSATGSVTTQNGERKVHIHATIADKDFRSYGGHLFRAITSKTIEILVNPL